MKMTDKSFAVKIDDKVFTGGEIYEMEIEGTNFKLFCGCESGTKYEITGNLKNLEFLSIPNTYKQFTNHQYCKAGDEPASDAELVTPLEQIRRAFRETSKCNNEMIYPSHPMHKKLTEAIEKIKEDPATEVSDTLYGKCYVCNSKAKFPDYLALKAVKDAANTIGKATEAIKVDLSIDGERFSKLIRDYGKPIALKGNDYEWVWVEDPVNGNHLAWAKKHNTGGD